VLGAGAVAEPGHELFLELGGREVRVPPRQVLLHDLAAGFEEVEGEQESSGCGLLRCGIHGLILPDPGLDHQPPGRRMEQAFFWMDPFDAVRDYG
jgi:hypothetical protein